MRAVQGSVTEADLESALRSVAMLIEQHGQKYWPIFERLEDELEALRSRRARLASVLAR